MEGVKSDPRSRPTTLSAPAPLTPDHDTGEFDCGEPVLDDWLKNRALKNESRFSRTYVVCEGKKVVAYFCISAGSVERSMAPGKLRRNAPEAIPVSIIGRLAVSRDYAGCGLGADLLSDALRRVAVASQTIGIGAVLVHAKDESAKRFYLGCAEFTEYPADSRTLFLPIETVIAAFNESG
ncbi:GNAT family N-acetyltransferase [uncultured Rhodoblastus sp.]|uniref:GNAT family N-acetyltransferase n=1 Tax=uncultured Rhodoblastus sp. TaxID=543037 RepID=UPI0025FA7559|nr:GNAT family N-acetyltransferase [uncultured Rhodoblastus sp.]